VRATGPYTLSTPATLGDNGSIVTFQSNLSVPEGEVNGDEDGEISVELERNEEELTIGDGSTDGGSGDSMSSDGSGVETQSLREPVVAGDAARAA
jgi:dolichyl-diphosphooligosaccharide--protein glycosyltransferase